MKKKIPAILALILATLSTSVIAEQTTPAAKKYKWHHPWFNKDIVSDSPPSWPYKIIGEKDGVILVEVTPTGSEKESAPPVPAPAPAQEPASKPDTATKSGGLGILKTEWEKIYGLPNRPCFSVASTTQCNYKNDLFITSFIDQNPIKSISYGNGNLKSKLSLEESRVWVKPLIPSDSVFIKTYTSNTGSIVDLYNSKWLAFQFPANDSLHWINSKPGDFIIIYSGKSGVSNITIGTGNNP